MMRDIDNAYSKSRRKGNKAYHTDNEGTFGDNRMSNDMTNSGSKRGR